MPIQTFIGLGSNLNQPIKQVTTAIQALSALPECRLLKHSSLYRTPPLGPPNQPDYINAVALLETHLAPLDLLDLLLKIEQNQGRIRDSQRWTARIIDLDLLLYGDASITHERLVLPHPHLHKRAFVLIPLSEIVPENLQIPGIGALATLLGQCDSTGIKILT